PGVQAVLVGGLRRYPQGTVADEDRQPAAGRPEWRPHRDLTNREHLPTVPVGRRDRSGTNVPPRTDEGPLAQLIGWSTVPGPTSPAGSAGPSVRLRLDTAWLPRSARGRSRPRDRLLPLADRRFS